MDDTDMDEDEEDMGAIEEEEEEEEEEVKPVGKKRKIAESAKAKVDGEF